MLDLTRLLEVSVELLAAIAAVVFVPPARFQEIAAAIGQNDRSVSVAFKRDGANQTLFPKMAKITSAWITGAAVMIGEVSTRHYPKRADGAERARLGPAKLVLLVAIADDFTFKALGQIEVMREHVARIDRITITVALVVNAITGIVSPTGIVEHAGSPIRLRRLGFTDPKPTRSESAKCKRDSRVCSREGSDATTRFLERRRFAERSWTGWWSRARPREREPVRRQRTSNRSRPSCFAYSYANGAKPARRPCTDSRPRPI